MAVESSYSIIKSALVDRLGTRGSLTVVNLLKHIPVNTDEIRTPVGTLEVIAMGDATGTFDDVVFCAGGLRFDETFDLTVMIQAQGVDSNATQAAMDARVNELLYEVLAEVADQGTWNRDHGLDAFDYVYFTPSTQDWHPGRLQATSVYACAMDLGLRVRARRNFT